MYLTIHKLEIWPMSWHIIHTLPIVFSTICMPSFLTRTLHQEYNFVVFISIRKKVAAQVLFKIRNLLVPVWLINFPYPYLAISNQVLVSYMTRLLAFIPTTSYYLLNIWLLPHNQINMTFYYVSVCIQKLRIFDNYYSPLAFSTPSGILFILMHLNNTILCVIRIQSGEILTRISLWQLSNLILK